MLRAIVLHAKDLTYVDKAVLEQSSKSTIGLCEEPGQDAGAASRSQVADAVADLQTETANPVDFVEQSDQERILKKP